MQQCYKVIDINFPDRGFLLFWQLPLYDKLKYFEIEDEIVALKNISEPEERKKRLDLLLSFLGANPVEKVDAAFEKKYKKGLMTYLDL